MINIVSLYFSLNEWFSQLTSYGLAVLRKFDKNMSTIYIENENQITFLNQAIEKKPDLVVVFVSYHSYDLLQKSCNYLRERLNNSVYITLCHNIASGLAEKMLYEFDSINSCIVGEFEKPLYELCNLLLNGNSPESCSSLSYIKNGSFVQNRPSNLLPLSEIPYPEREAFNTDTRYFAMLGSRGCEGNCTFCDRNMLFRSFMRSTPRYREVSDIVNEIDYLVDKYNCKFVSFNDSTFCSSQNIICRLDQLYKVLFPKKYWVQFLICLRSEQISLPVIYQIKNLMTVGLGKVYIGLESFNKFDLELYGKISDVQTNICAISNLKLLEHATDNYILNIGYGFINFNPYSTLSGLKNNLVELDRNNINIDPYIVTTKLSLNCFAPLTKRIDKDGLLYKSLEDMSVKELMNRRLNYSFVNHNVQDAFDILSFCKKYLNYKNVQGYEFIRNRYLHFLGYDSILERYDAMYQERASVVHKYTYNLCNYIFSSADNKIKKLSNSTNLCDEFLNRYKPVDDGLISIKKRLVIELSKIDELIFNKLNH